MSELTNGLVPQLQAKNAALEARVAELEGKLEQIRILARDEQWSNVTAQINRIWRLAGGDKFLQTPAAAPVADAPVQSESLTLFTIVRSIKKLVTQHNETMAVLTVDEGEIVVFPRSWAQYRDVIENSGMLPFRVKPDNSKGYTQYILESIEGVEPAEFPPALYCSNCGKRLGEACCKSNFVDGMFCSAACTSEYEKERHVPDMPSATPPAPRFKVGDKVRIKGREYPDQFGHEYEVVDYIDPDENYGRYALDYGGEHKITYAPIWRDYELEAYSESEGE